MVWVLAIRTAIASTVKFLPRIGTSITRFAKTGLGKTAIVTGVSIPITAGIGKSVGNITSAFGINKTENIKNEIAKLESQKAILESSGNANIGAINAVQDDGNNKGSLDVKEILLMGGLIIAAGIGVYFVAKKK